VRSSGCSSSPASTLLSSSLSLRSRSSHSDASWSCPLPSRLAVAWLDRFLLAILSREMSGGSGDQHRSCLCPVRVPYPFPWLRGGRRVQDDTGRGVNLRGIYVTKLALVSARRGPSRPTSLPATTQERPSPLRGKQKRVWSMRIRDVGAPPLSMDSMRPIAHCRINK